ncbi:MAG: hypothetical protein LBJ41_11535 [Treponema sp.]|jgi:hypothetical protein|nr:hypothetical protein [Treponema sp.]
MIKKRFFIAFACVALLFCRVTSVSAAALYQKESELPDARQYILDALAQNKLVFIGENHELVNEELFMAENLQSFYDAGLRYLFEEGPELGYDPSRTPLPGEPDYRLLIFPPWRTDVGGKYEAGAMSRAIREINNAVLEEERIREIPAEAGYNPTPEEVDFTQGDHMNKRDQQAFKNISEFMETLPPHKKAMIFFGGAHGQTKPIQDRIDGEEPFLWTPMGVYLKDRYGDNFISMVLRSAKDERHNIYLDIPELRDIESRPKIVLPNSRSDIVKDDRIQGLLSQYDAVILDREVTFGTGANYMPTYEHLFAMYNGLRNLEDSMDNWKNDVAILRGQDQGQYLQYIYYLKMWLGDSFDYRLWDTMKPLREALDELSMSKIQEIALTLNAQDVRNTQRMRDYSKAMLLSVLTEFVYDDFMYPLEEIYDEVILIIVDHMKEAIAIFPQDLWPYYWLAHVETETGDYDAAIEHWEYIIAQPLAYCLETLPRVYEKLSVCYAAKGDQARSDDYKTAGERLMNEHNLIVTNLNDVK